MAHVGGVFFKLLFLSNKSDISNVSVERHSRKEIFCGLFYLHDTVSFEYGIYLFVCFCMSGEETILEQLC